ncbi:MAG: protein kinase [Anaerolineae bacterium]|nr:protein kinase [Anaerolineae bacterium]
MDNLAGQVLKSYQISELIDMGGFGAVYRAHQAVVEREVAVKIIYPVFANRPAFIRQFEAEAQLVASLEHPHIVPLYDYWRDPNGAYIVMRWLRGGHLRTRMGRAWTPQEVATLLIQVGGALAFAHRYGVVHRDLKPENILLDEDGNAYLADFGIAQILSSPENDDEVMLSSMGSPAYAAPEQVMNNPTTAACDIYSFGVILYELLTGLHPFPDLADLTMTELSDKRMKEMLPSILEMRPELPTTLDQVIQKATAIDPDQRYPDVVTLINAYRIAMLGDDYTVTQESLTAEIPNPYKGLRAFQEGDANNFYGRKLLITQLLRRLAETIGYSRFLAVVGPSGSGKSSVVKAGLIPTLKQGALPNAERWYYVEMVPGNDPFKELETALTGVAVESASQLRLHLLNSALGLKEIMPDILPEDPRVELFLFIDQFEEVFTLVENDNIGNRFLESLYHAVSDPKSRLRVVITLRADFYDRPLQRPYVSELMSRRTEVVIPMNPDELEQAITRPARRVGVNLEPGLVTEIINEVKEQMGALPLLQYLMSELFNERDGNRLTLEAYRKMGGVRGALARRADDIFEAMTAPEQEVTRQLFLRLVTLGEGTEDTRRRALIMELASINPHASAVIETLGKSRLVTFDRDPITRSPTVEIAHEAIIREWKRLRQWLDVSRTDVRMQRNLATIASEWLGASYDGSYLLRGIRLEQYEQWFKETSIALTRDEQQLLDASLREREAREAEEKQRLEREERLERRARDRLRILVAVLSVATLLALGLMSFALNESRRAQLESEISASLAHEASARRALSDADGDLAVILALEANRIENPLPQAWRTLSEVALAPGTRLVMEGHNGGVISVDISPDGTRAISGGYDRTVRVWDLQTGQAINAPLEGHRADVIAIRFSSDGRYAASSATNGEVLIWDLVEHRLLHQLWIHRNQVHALAFTPDNTRLVSAGEDLDIILWDIQTGQALQTIENAHIASINVLVITPDQTTLITGAGNGEIVIWDFPAMQVRYQLRTELTVRDLELIADGSAFVTVDTNDQLSVWEVATGTLLSEFKHSGDVINNAVLLPGGQQVLLTTERGDLELWNIAENRLIERMRGHSQKVNDLALDHQGRYAISASLDGTIRLWNLFDPLLYRQQRAHEFRVTEVDFSRDGQSYLTASIDGTMTLWDFQSATPRVQYPPAGVESDGLVAIALHPDQRQVLFADRTHQISVWDTVTQTVRTVFTGHTDNVQSIHFSADGREVISTDRDGWVILWTLADGSEIRRFEGHEDYVYEAVISGDRLLTGSRDTRLIWWNLTTGQAEQTFSSHRAAVWSVDVSPDGRWAVSGAQDGVIVISDLQTGRESARLIGHADAVWSVRFSPDGRHLLSGSVDRVVILWDAISGSELQRYQAGASVFDVAFSSDNRYVIAGEEGGTIQIWQIFNLPDLLTWTQDNRYIRSLSCSESALYRIANAMCG